MRALRLVAVLLIVGCAHKPPPAPPPPPPPPPPPKGDTLRFKAKPGDGVRNKAKVVIDQEIAPAEKKAKPTTLAISFSFGEEESVTAVDPDGSQLVTARLVDAVGESQVPTNQRVVDDMALAFDELKIQFKRQARGDVVALGLSGLRKPLDEATARQVLNAMFGAQRGALFPETPIDIGGTWKVSIPIPESTGLAGEVHYDYTYARKEGGVAIIGAEGRFEGTKKNGANESHSTGKSTTEYHFDIAAGRMVSSSVDQITQVEVVGPDKGSVKQHLRVEWAPDKEKAE
jgi:hypothetical protein